MFKRLQRYGNVLNTHDLIKIVAITLMMVDHIGKYAFPEVLWLRLMGRAAAPLFFFLIGFQGKVHLSLALFVYAVILTVSNYVFEHQYYINILFNFVFIHFALQAFQINNVRLWQWLVLFAVMTACNFYLYRYLEYGTLGLLIALSIRMLQINHPFAKHFLAYSLGFYFIWESVLFNLLAKPSMMLAIVVLACVLYHAMLSFRVRAVIVASWLKWPGLLLSRYSLEVYFVHLMFLKLWFLNYI